jgi:hypothetical protein
MTSIKILLRAAKCLYAIWHNQSFQGRRSYRCSLQRLVANQQAVDRAVRLLDKANAHHWHLAESQLQSNLLVLVQADQELAADAQKHLEPPRFAVPSIDSLVAELRQIEEEFGALQLDWDKKGLSAVTEPISLKGVWV